MLPEVERRLLARWPSLFPRERAPARLRFLNACGSIEGGTTTFLAFASGAARPACAIKVNRASGGDEMLRREAALLELLNAHSGFAGTVPRLLMSETIGSHHCLVQSMVSGRGMQAPLDAAGQPVIAEAERRFGAVRQWLKELNRATVTHQRGSLEAARVRLLSIADRFVDVFQLGANERAVVEHARAAVDRLLEGGLVVRHGDFSRHNILVEGSSIGVIDWTYASADGPVLYDLLSFAVTYFLQSGRAGLAGRVDAFAATFLQTTAFQRLVERAIDEYCAAIGLARPDRRLHLTWFLIERAMFEHALVTAAASRGAFPRGVLSLAAERRSRADEAGTLQVWIELFRASAERAGDAA